MKLTARNYELWEKKIILLTVSVTARKKVLVPPTYPNCGTTEKAISWDAKILISPGT